MTDRPTNKSWKNLKRKVMFFNLDYPLLPKIPKNKLARFLFKDFIKEYDAFVPKYQELLNEVDTSRTIESATIKIYEKQTDK